jgi:uncharacterized paraquat-inducible protein A
MTDKNSSKAETKIVEKPSSSERILTLTTWARIVSWVLFGIGGILIVIALIQAADEIGSGYSIFESLLLIILSLLPIFLGLVLQFLIEGIRLAVDIEQNTRGNSKS